MPTPHAHMVLGFAFPARPANLKASADFNLFPLSTTGLFEYPRENGAVIFGQKVSPADIKSFFSLGSFISGVDQLRTNMEKELTSQGIEFDEDTFSVHLSNHYG